MRVHMSVHKKKEISTTVWDVVRVFIQETKPNQVSFWLAIWGSTVRAFCYALLPVYIKKIFDVFLLQESKEILIPVVFKLFALALTIRIIGWIHSNILFFSLSKLESKVMPALKRRAFEYVTRHSHEFFSNTFVGSLVSKINKFAKSYELFIDRFIIDVVSTFIQVGSIIYIVGQTSYIFSLIILCTACVFIFVNIVFSRIKKPSDIHANEVESKVTGYLADSIANNNTVSLFAAHDFENENFRKETKDQEIALWKKWSIGSLLDGLQGLVIIVGDFAVLYYAIVLWEQNMITIGTIVMFQLFMSGLTIKLWDFTRVIRQLYEAYADVYEMMHIFKTPHEFIDQPHAKKYIVQKGTISFDHVNFAYNAQGNNILNEFTLDIQAGEKIALIGSSGAGKSTYVKLLLRLYDPQSGSIKIDGVNIQDMTLDSLHLAIAVVSQDPILFHRTLMENIRYGKRDATDEEVYEAARRAHADEFIRKFPQGYDTFVGERGVKLSGGERQRVAIARALLKNAPILILDEATSALDSESERLIQDAFATLMQGRTSIVIAHRLSTIRHMDRIVVIEEGAIVEEGTHEALLKKKKGIYAKLWNMQAGGFLKEN